MHLKTFMSGTSATTPTATAPPADTTHHRWVRAVLTVAAAAGALITVGLTTIMAAPAAHAHDELVGYSVVTTPGSDTSPSGFMLNFNNELNQIGAEVRATDADGNSITNGEPVLSGRDLTQSFITPLEPAEYPILWTVVSSDGHKIAGALTLTVTADSAATLTVADLPPVAHTSDADAAPDATETSGPATGVTIAVILGGVGVLGAIIAIILRKFRAPGNTNLPGGDA